MSERSRMLRGGARAITGVALAAAATVAAVLIGNAALPTIGSDAVAVTVSTEQNSLRQLVCAGSFAELGVNPKEPTNAVPSGTAEVTVVGEAQDKFDLSRDVSGDGSPPVAVQAESGSLLGAAQEQLVSSSRLRGLAASACAEPVNEQWVVGSSTELGMSSTLSLGNASDVPATAQITLFDENGEIEASQTTGVLVPPKSERTVSLNGYAPDRERLVARVMSTGATVTATIGTGQTLDIRPFAADTITRQLEPQEKLVIPGVTHVNDHAGYHTDEDGSHPDEFPVQVRVLAPGDDAKNAKGGTATVTAITKTGNVRDLGEIVLEPGVVTDLTVKDWPEDANAVIIESDVEVVGGVKVSAHEANSHDFAWLAPAPEMAANTQVAAPVVGGGKLVLVNRGSEDAEATVERQKPGKKDKPNTVKVPAGGAILVPASADSLLTSDQPLFAGVQIASGSNIAGYPILPLASREVEMTVYPR